jgi:hypothetical protein
LLEELEDQLRILAASALPRDHQVRSLVAARRRVWLAMAALGSRPDSLRCWAGLPRVARQRAPVRTVLLAPATLVARAVFLLFLSAWWSMRAILRMAYTLRAIWP